MANANPPVGVSTFTAYSGQQEVAPIGIIPSRLRPTNNAFAARFIEITTSIEDAPTAIEDAALPFGTAQDGADTLEVFLFDESWPIAVQLFHSFDQKVRKSQVVDINNTPVDPAIYSNLPDSGYNQFVSLGGVPSGNLITVAGVDATHPIPRGRGVYATTISNQIQVAGHYLVCKITRPTNNAVLQVQNAQATEISTYEITTLVATCRATVVSGEPGGYDGNVDVTVSAGNPGYLPCIVNEKLYTSVIANAGNIFNIVTGGFTAQFKVVGIYATTSPN